MSFEEVLYLFNAELDVHDFVLYNQIVCAFIKLLLGYNLDISVLGYIIINIFRIPSLSLSLFVDSCVIGSFQKSAIKWLKTLQICEEESTKVSNYHELRFKYYVINFGRFITPLRNHFYSSFIWYNNM